MQKHSGRSLFVLHPNCALFLDIDGTLLDIAQTPEAVVVPPHLVSLLSRIFELLDGALALVSGRPLKQVDELFAPLRLTCAGEHGAVLRLPNGVVEKGKPAAAIPQSWRERVRYLTKNMPGVRVEPKTFGVAVHYRQAPECEAELRSVLEDIVSENRRDFEMMPAAMAFEIRNRRMTKAAPVERLMTMPPFAGRVPVFVGDDVTDRDGFRAAKSLGGVALDVHEVFGGRPSQVLGWLEKSVSRGTV